MKMLVTGGDGFIGSHLAEKLVAKGAKVRVLVMYNSFGHSGWLENVEPEIKTKMEIIPGDVRDPQAMIEITDNIETIFHLASLIAIPYSYRSADSYVDTNIKGTLNILQAARRNQAVQVIHASTSEVYGKAVSVPISEDHPIVSHSPYAATKIAADQMATAFHRSFDLPVTIIRPFNTYGPRQSARAIIPTVVSQLLADGATLRLGHLTPTRDFTYVSDIVDGFIAAAGKEETIGEVIHLGSGSEISIGDLAGRIAALMNREVAIATDSQRLRPETGEVERLLCDNSKAKQLLGWEPTIQLDDGLRRTIEWLSKHKDLPGYQSDQYVI
jgi:NAD dependent epimerase/dehydratase